MQFICHRQIVYGIVIPIQRLMACKLLKAYRIPIGQIRRANKASCPKKVNLLGQVAPQMYDIRLSRVMRTPGSVQIGCIHVGEAGVVGYHPAVCPQLFLVVNGKGWVCGEDRKRIAVGPGQAASYLQQMRDGRKMILRDLR